MYFYYIRSVSDSRLGLGLGFDRIFDEHKYNTMSIVAAYRLAKRFGLNISPSIIFEDESGIKESNVVLYFEAVYEFGFKNFHVGPAAELAYDPEDYHLSLGVHIGFGF